MHRLSLLFLNIVFFMVALISTSTTANAIPSNESCPPAVTAISSEMLAEIPKKDMGKALSSLLPGGGGGGMPSMGGPFGGGGMVFGGSGGQRKRHGKKPDRLEPKPDGLWNTFTSPDGNGSVDMALQLRGGGRQLGLGLRVNQGRGDAVPHGIWLQHVNGELLVPVQILIFEKWMNWTLTITYWKDTYVDGKLIKHEILGVEQFRWSELKDRYAKVITGPAIWQRLDSDPFGSIRGVVAVFNLPQGFNPNEWSAIAQVTGEAEVDGKKVIKTDPYTADLGGNYKLGGFYYPKRGGGYTVRGVDGKKQNKDDDWVKRLQENFDFLSSKKTHAHVRSRWLDGAAQGSANDSDIDVGSWDTSIAPRVGVAYDVTGDGKLNVVNNGLFSDRSLSSRGKGAYWTPTNNSMLAEADSLLRDQMQDRNNQGAANAGNDALRYDAPRLGPGANLDLGGAANAEADWEQARKNPGSLSQARGFELWLEAPSSGVGSTRLTRKLGCGGELDMPQMRH